MKLRFDQDLKIASVVKSPWVRLGPERWLPAYAIASFHGWDRPADQPPMLLPLTELVAETAWPKATELQSSPVFRNIISERLPGFDILPSSMSGAAEAFPGRHLLGNEPGMCADYEDKAFFRRRFADTLTFPDFMIMDRDGLAPDESGYASVMAGRQTIVLQDTRLKAGKGSFIIRDFKDYQQALHSLDAMSAQGDVVVSDFVDNAIECSIQGCVTAERIYTGPLQQQIIRHPLLAKLDRPETEKFCGVQIMAADQGSAAHRAAQQAAEVVGADLRAAGYHGIFGLDFMLSEDGRLYLLELNPRITGATPLLSELAIDGQVPFLLLHLLELGGYDYEVSDDSLSAWSEGALLMLHSQNDTYSLMDDLPRSGIYRMDDGGLKRSKQSMALADASEHEFLLQAYHPVGKRIKPGGRMACLMFRRPVADRDGRLHDDVVRTIEAVQRAVVLSQED
jgi:hypothetical protein